MARTTIMRVKLETARFSPDRLERVEDLLQSSGLKSSFSAAALSSICASVRAASISRVGSVSSAPNNSQFDRALVVQLRDEAPTNGLPQIVVTATRIAYV